MTSNIPAPDIMDTHLQLASISDVVIENNVSPRPTTRLAPAMISCVKVRPDIIMVPRPGLRAHRPLCRV